jgi:hypothetical protein
MAFRDESSMHPNLNIVSPLKRSILDRSLSLAIRLREELHFHKGLTIAHTPREYRAEAIENIKAAINLIESSDPRRLARLTRVVDFVCSTGGGSTWAFYSPRSKICVVNVIRVSRERPKRRDLIATIAALLVSSSVDGLLYEKGISRSKLNSAKVERLRQTEMARFFQRVVNDEAQLQRIFPTDGLPEIFQSAGVRSLAPFPRTSHAQRHALD